MEVQLELPLEKDPPKAYPQPEKPPLVPPKREYQFGYALGWSDTCDCPTCKAGYYK